MRWSKGDRVVIPKPGWEGFVYRIDKLTKKEATLTMVLTDQGVENPTDHPDGIEAHVPVSLMAHEQEPTALSPSPKSKSPKKRSKAADSDSEEDPGTGAKAKKKALKPAAKSKKAKTAATPAAAGALTGRKRRASSTPVCYKEKNALSGSDFEDSDAEEPEEEDDDDDHAAVEPDPEEEDEEVSTRQRLHPVSHVALATLRLSLPFYHRLADPLPAPPCLPAG